MNSLRVGLIGGMKVVCKTRSHRRTLIELRTTRGVNANRIVRAMTHRRKF